MVEIVWGEGPQPAALMIVGERPGLEEIESGHPFVGPAGRKLDHYLFVAGIERYAAYVTNLVKTFRNYFKPNDEEIREWMPVLMQEITDTDPKVIALLGTFAVEALIPDWRPAKLTSRHGKIFKLPCGTMIVPCYHPAAGLYSRDSDIKLEYDFAQVALALKGTKLTTPLHFEEIENESLQF